MLLMLSRISHLSHSQGVGHLEMEFGIVSTIDNALTSITSAYRTNTSCTEPKYRSRRL